MKIIERLFGPRKKVGRPKRLAAEGKQNVSAEDTSRLLSKRNFLGLSMATMLLAAEEYQFGLLRSFFGESPRTVPSGNGLGETESEDICFQRIIEDINPQNIQQKIKEGQEIANKILAIESFTIESLLKEPLLAQMYVCLYRGLEPLKESDETVYFKYIANLILSVVESLHEKKAIYYIVDSSRFDDCSIFPPETVDLQLQGKIYPEGRNPGFGEAVSGNVNLGGTYTLVGDLPNITFVSIPNILTELKIPQVSNAIASFNKRPVDPIFYKTLAVAFHEAGHATAEKKDNSAILEMNLLLHEQIQKFILSYFEDKLLNIPEGKNKDVISKYLTGDSTVTCGYEIKGLSITIFLQEGAERVNFSLGHISGATEAMAELHSVVLLYELGVEGVFISPSYYDYFSNFVRFISGIAGDSSLNPDGGINMGFLTQLDRAMLKGFSEFIEIVLKEVPYEQRSEKTNEIIEYVFKYKA